MIRVLHRAFDMLELLAADPTSLKKLNKIAPRLHIHPATCANILKTMVNRNYVDQVAPRTGYTLGPMIYHLARGGAYRGDLTSAAEPLMAALAKKVNETVLLVTLRGGKRFTVAQIDGKQTVQIDRNLFFQDTIYQTATGRLLLAHLSERNMEALIAGQGLPGSRWPEAGSLSRLKSELAKIRRRAWVCHQTDNGVVGIACPVSKDGKSRAGSDKVVAALGLFLPAFRFKGAHKSAIMKGISATVAAISTRLSSSENKLNPALIKE